MKTKDTTIIKGKSKKQHIHIVENVKDQKICEICGCIAEYRDINNGMVIWACQKCVKRRCTA